MNPDDCKHENFHATVEVTRLTKDEGGGPYAFSADVKIQCAGCLLPFKFLGLGVGMSSLEPLTDVTGQELHAPIVPVGREDMVGTLGYRITVPGSGPKNIH